MSLSLVGVLDVEVHDRSARLRVLISNVGPLFEYEQHPADIERALLGLIRGERCPIPGAQPIGIGAANQDAANERSLSSVSPLG